MPQYEQLLSLGCAVLLSLNVSLCCGGECPPTRPLPAAPPQVARLQGRLGETQRALEAALLEKQALEAELEQLRRQARAGSVAAAQVAEVSGF